MSGFKAIAVDEVAPQSGVEGSVNSQPRILRGVFLNTPHAR